MALPLEREAVQEIERALSLEGASIAVAQ